MVTVRSFALVAATTALAALATVACETRQPTPPEEVTASVAAQERSIPVVTDATPRNHASIERILAVLDDPQKSDGTLLVGVRELGAVRGVSTTGVRLPRQAALEAEKAIIRDFRELELIAGTVGFVLLREPTRTRIDTVYRTYINVRAPTEAAFLEKLRSQPLVDYIVPNRIDAIVTGVSGDAPMVLMRPAALESRPWGVDSVRAPDVWAQGWQGGEINFGMVDTGIDIEPSGACHPDFNCSKLFFYSTVEPPQKNKAQIDIFQRAQFIYDDTASPALRCSYVPSENRPPFWFEWDRILNNLVDGIGAHASADLLDAISGVMVTDRIDRSA